MEKSTGSSKERPTRRATDLPVTTSNRNREQLRSLGQSDSVILCWRWQKSLFSNTD